MSLFSSFIDLNKKVAAFVSPVLSPIATIVAHPIQSIEAALSPTKTFAQVEASHFSQPVATQIKQTSLGVVAVATTGIGLASGAIAKGIGLASTILPTTTKGKIVAAATLPIVASAVINKPSLAVSVPSDILNFQSNAGKVLANPSVSSVKNLIVENPIISSVVAAGTLATVGYGAANLVSTYSNTQAVKENTQTTSKGYEYHTTTPEELAKYTPTSQPIQIINQLPPTTPEVVAPLDNNPKVAPSGVESKKVVPKKKKKKKKKVVPKKKKKTRRSKKKKVIKRKKKTIKRKKK
jgi:hypothetical protein